MFDLDGVLIDSIDAMRLAFEAAYDEVVGTGAAPFEQYLLHLGRHMPDILELMRLPAQMYPAFSRHSEALLHRIPASDGAAALLDELRAAGVPVVVATGKSRCRADLVLDAVGLLDRLDAVCGSDEVRCGKPAPDLVLLALERVGASPDGAFMVGDSVLDLEAGRAAGTRTAAALWGHGRPEDLLSCRPDLASLSCHQLRAQLGALVGVRS
ncbi:MAG: HAD-IA family hydrolase [Frankiaceae bacterium]